MRVNSKQFGFSLIELMITITIIGVLSAFAIPSYKVWIKNTRIRTTAESIQNGLQKAKTEALRHNARVILTLNNASWTFGCVTPRPDNDGDGVDDCPATIETDPATEASSDILINTDTGNFVITFTNLGTRDSALAGGEFNAVNIDINGISTAESRDLRVTVGAGGNVRMCDPAFSLPDPKGC